MTCEDFSQFWGCFLVDFRDTWAFLDARVKDAFNIKKTIQEVILMLLQWLVPQLFQISIISKYQAWWIPGFLSHHNFQAQSLAEAVSVGLGNSFQGFVGKVFQRWVTAGRCASGRHLCLGLYVACFIKQCFWGNESHLKEILYLHYAYHLKKKKVIFHVLQIYIRFGQFIRGLSSRTAKNFSLVNNSIISW